MAEFNVVVVGASAGGVEALIRLVEGLPADMDAAVLIVIHMPPNSRSVLPQILSRSQRMPATHPADGQRIQPGRIYVAPADFHLLLTDDHRVTLAKGPKENGCRPAIDPLFRSAAVHYRHRAIGVVLSGTLDDGSAGLLSIKKVGGVCIAQEPKDALFSGMPQNAIDAADPDYILPADEIGTVLGKLCLNPAAELSIASDLESIELQIDRLEAPHDATKQTGKNSEFGCPDCGGTLWEIQETKGDFRFRCRVGHAYSSVSLLEDQSTNVERAIWTAMRALREKADLCKRLALRFKNKSKLDLSVRYEREAMQARSEADLLQTLVKNSPGQRDYLGASSSQADLGSSRDQLEAPVDEARRSGKVVDLPLPVPDSPLGAEGT